MRDAAVIKRWETVIPRAIGIVAVVLSLSLAAMLWFVHRAVDQASIVLLHGQGSRYVMAAHEWLRSQPRPPRPGVFNEFVLQHTTDGLRYIALFRPGTPIIETQAGEPAAPIDERTIRSLHPGEPMFIGTRVRFMMGPPQREPPPPGHPPIDGWPPPGGPPPPGFGGRPPPDGPPPFGAGPGPNGPGPPPDPPAMVIEFEPLQATQMDAYARRTLLVGLISIPAFLGGAIFLAILVRQREQLSERLGHQRRLAALGEMAAMIAHEIRNPLTSLKGHAQLLRKSLAGDTRDEKAQRIVSEAVRLESFLNDLLDFSRTGAINPQPVSPARVLQDCAESVQPERIVVHSDGAPPSWRMDAPRMQQALANVLRNAVQISPQDASIDAAVFAENGHLVFEVRDAGPGIPAGEEERIFEPFYTRTARGTGLGLPLARRIVVQHRGTITAQNQPGGGAVFRISLEKL